MSPLTRSVFAAAGFGLAALDPAPVIGSVPSQPEPPRNPEVAALLQRSADANAALVRGDVDRYRALVPMADDFTLMSPFGGTPSHASDITEERWDAMKRFFRHGTFSQEVVQTYASTDLVVLAVIERVHGDIGDLPPQDWALRVTLVYRRDGSDWRLVHRHADPLVHGIGVARSAALARGAG